MSIRKRSEPHRRLDALSYAHRLWEAMDTPTSLKMHLLAKAGEMRQLVEADINPLDYRDPVSFLKDHQSVKVLAKYPYLDTGIDTEEMALRKFIEAEIQCLSTNERFRSGAFDHLSDRVKRAFRTAQHKVSFILGDVPEFEDMDFSFGPGAAYGVRGDTSVYKKVSSTLECTPAFVDILPVFLGEFPGWVSAEAPVDVKIVPGSQLIVVPKNAKTGRPICIEPLLNGFYQKGVGSWIRNRLQRFGVDLDDQSVNQKLAGEAFTEGLSTVDFSSASDTIAYHFVLDFLPITWFEFLNVARCPEYQIQENWYSFHKFTSMGNAYTFELETLIFYCLACACCEELGIPYQTGKNLSVYGDDVIIPRDAFDLFSEVAEACGFTINKKKSFKEGCFFESCGHDFFMGTFVRPLLLSKKLNTLPSAFYAANSTFRVFQRLKNAHATNCMDFDPVDRRRFRDVYDWVVGCIPPDLRVVGPEGYGDGHLISSLPQGEDRRHPSWDGWWFYTYVEKPRRLKLNEVPTAYALYFTRRQENNGERFIPFNVIFNKIPEPIYAGKGYSVRGGENRFSRVKVFCHFIWQDTSW